MNFIEDYEFILKNVVCVLLSSIVYYLEDDSKWLKVKYSFLIAYKMFDLFKVIAKGNIAFCRYKDKECKRI